MPWWGPAQYGGWWEKGMRHRGWCGPLLGRREGLLEEVPVARQLVVVLLRLVGRLGRVDGDQLEVGAVPEPVVQARVDRRPRDLGLLGEADVGEQVVGELVTVVGRLALRRVVVADAGVDRHAADRVAVRGVEAEVPVVVGVPGARDRVLLADVDVVAGGHHEPDARVVDGPLEGIGQPPLSVPVATRGQDAGPVVPDHREPGGRDHVGSREGPEPGVVLAVPLLEVPACLGAVVDPVASGPDGPGLPVDRHPVPVGGVGAQAADPDVVGLGRLRPCHHLPALELDDLHLGISDRRRGGPDGPASSRRVAELVELLVLDDPPGIVVAVGVAEPEPAPGDQRVVVGEPGQVQERFEVQGGVAHRGPLVGSVPGSKPMRAADSGHVASPAWPTAR